MKVPPTHLEAVKLMIKEIIVNDLDANVSIEQIGDDISLFDDGIGLDSIAIINFIIITEKKFDISFDESEISSKLFSTVNNLAAFVVEKQQSALSQKTDTL